MQFVSEVASPLHVPLEVDTNLNVVSASKDSLGQGEEVVDVIHRKRTTEPCFVEDDMNELLEMQRLGIKVALPSAKVRRITTDPQHAHSDTAVTPCAFPFAHIAIDDLQDWIDLAELGGSPVWPEGLNCTRAREELRRRSNHPS